VSIDDLEIKILEYHEHTKYLGRKVCFDSFHATELDNRIASGWKKFHLLRDELTSKTYPLTSRLRLLDGTVTPTVLYGCTSWTLTQDMMTKLQRAQRRMLRLVIGTPRRHTSTTTTTAEPPNATTASTPTTQQHDRSNPCSIDTREANDSNNDANNTDSQSADDVASITSDKINVDHVDLTPHEDTQEPWSEFIKRATRIAEQSIDKLGIEEWTATVCKRKWRWAHRIATQPSDRWTRLAAEWEPEVHDTRQTTRQQGRPRRRWEDDLTSFLITSTTTTTIRKHEQPDHHNPPNNASPFYDSNYGRPSTNNRYDDDSNNNDSLNDKPRANENTDDSDDDSNNNDSLNDKPRANWLELVRQQSSQTLEKHYLQHILSKHD
jgi:hypothetical protein